MHKLITPYQAHKPEPVIETERTYLRYFRESDQDDMWEMDSDPEVHQFLGNKPITKRNQAHQAIKGILEQYQNNGIGRLVIIDKNTNECIGWCGLKWETDFIPGKPYYDLGYRLKRKHWKKGYGKETAKSVLRYGFEELRLPQICAAADVNNIGSNKILNSLGMELKSTITYENIPCYWYEKSNPQ